MEYIKKNWKIILIAILVVFSLNKCTVACNRDTKLNKQAIELVKKDSIIKVQSDSLNILNIRWGDAQTNKKDLVGVALNTKQELSDRIEQLVYENNTLSQKVNSLTTENNKLKKENKELKAKINK